MTNPATTKPTAAMLTAFRNYMSATPRCMSVSANLRHNQAYTKLEAKCKERGLSLLDLEDFEVRDGKVVRTA